jgi:2-keto-4-pentenoate hydratase
VTLQPPPAAGFDAAEIARRFVAARRAAVALPDFPGPLPADMAAGYAVQEAAIRLWPDEIAGWKVGRIPKELQAELGAERVMGPIFRRNVWRAAPEPTPVPVIAGGFAAVEAEYVYRLGADAPPGKANWTAETAVALVEAALVGMEFAASPLAAINLLGPRVVAADFGNNAGLILGPELADPRSTGGWPACETFVDGARVGQGSPAAIPGGPAASLAFLLNAAAERARPLKRGQLVTTGAASGIHDIRAGQTARIAFDGVGEIRCAAEPARPAADTGGEPR